MRYADRNGSAEETGIREVTLRSMMGSYGGNSGLFSAWFDEASEEWRYRIQMCEFGVQHWWWAVHVLDVVTVWIGVLCGIMEIAERFGALKGPVRVGRGEQGVLDVKKAVARGQSGDRGEIGKKASMKRTRKKG
jgi:hypothetical protein